MSQFNLPEIEEKVLQDWQDKNVFKQSLEQEASKGDFVFYEGPPTANGRPGIHHVLARAFKDLIPRFKTMQGYRVERKAGWDTHGLPVELEVEKRLGLKNKKDIEEYGIAKFNEECKKSVWQYLEEWERITERIGFWLDLERPYITYQNSYIESLWWIIKQWWQQDLFYQGHKVVPHCPRCGTALSSHEVAQGYKTINEPSVYIKFKVLEFNDKLKFTNDDDVYILAWTTTPWTLPGNVALAVGEEIKYAVVKQNSEYLILADDLKSVLTGEYEMVDTVKGRDLLALTYEPLFNSLVDADGNKHLVVAAGFVSTVDGTGVVHTAVMYGDDDYKLGEEIGLPKEHTVNLDGTFNERVPEWQGRFVKDVEPEIIEQLKNRGLLYKTEDYEHEYPFCWRCKTPLLYYAKDSWFVAVTKLKDKLISNNEDINWYPGHIKYGRFGDWLKEVKDWAFSRERYWGTPLPIWQCSSENCSEMQVVGSYEELPVFKPLNNTYYLMRHGQATKNIPDIINGDLKKDEYPLTDLGRQISEAAAVQLESEKIDLIFSSPFLRTRQTAEIVSKVVNLPVEVNEDLREVSAGEMEGMPHVEAEAKYGGIEKRIGKNVAGHESLKDVKQRMLGVIEELEGKHKGKNIVIISHGDPLIALISALSGSQEMEVYRQSYPKVGQIYQFNKSYQGESEYFDPHRPFIDDITLPCPACGSEMQRVSDVVDVWFDSGAMPLAQYHYPFENKDLIDCDETLPFDSTQGKLAQGGSSANCQFPADFICEAVDQTRGWFYTLLTVSTLLGRGTPFKNVICLGHILDKKGLKMSKSLGNIVDPWEMMDKYGVDAIRWYFYTLSSPGEPKRFDEQGLKESSRMFITLLNVVSFYKMFAPDIVDDLEEKDLTNILDKWINAELNRVIVKVTQALEEYDITGAARLVNDFINELSTWYVRRSRDRFKSDDDALKIPAIKTLRHVIFNISRLLAPFTPFVADYVYNEKMQGHGSSVHLRPWPETYLANEKTDKEVLEKMERARQVVEMGLAARDEAKLPVKQPLRLLTINNLPLTLEKQYLELIKDELNVKNVTLSLSKGTEEITVVLDTNITKELKLEGLKRDLVRQINNLRKQQKLSIQDVVKLGIETSSDDIREVIAKFKDDILQATISSEITKAGKNSQEIKVGGEIIKISLSK